MIFQHTHKQAMSIQLKLHLAVNRRRIESGRAPLAEGEAPTAGEVQAAWLTLESERGAEMQQYRQRRTLALPVLGQSTLINATEEARLAREQG